MRLKPDGRNYKFDSQKRGGGAATPFIYYPRFDCDILSKKNSKNFHVG